jgi:hypothetical protein
MVELQDPFESEEEESPAGEPTLQRSVGRFGNTLSYVFSKPIKERYPYLSATPDLFMEEAGEFVRFCAILPPFTVLVTDGYMFFETLGFPTDKVIKTANYRLKGSPNPTTVWGFTNKTSQSVKLKGKLLGRDEPIADRYETYCPEEFQISNPSIEVRYLTDILSVQTQEAQPLTRQHAMSSISVLLDDALRILSVKPDAVAVVFEGNQIYLRSKEFETGVISGKRKDEAKGTATVKIKFSLPEVRNYFQLDDSVMEFPLNDSRAVELRPVEEDVYDAMSPYYPVALQCVSHGSADHHLGRAGKMSLLGIVNSPFDVVSYDLEMTAGNHFLVLRLLDKFHRPIKIDRPLTFHVGLQVSLL